MTTVTGEIKVIKDYGVDGKHNWFTVINDAEGIEHKAYSNANLSEFAKDDIVQVEGMTKSGKAGAYIACNKFMRVGDAMNQDSTPAAYTPASTYTPKPALQRTSENSQVNTSKDESMVKTGISTRGAAAILYGLTVANRPWSNVDTHNFKAALMAAKTIDVTEATVKAPEKPVVDEEELDDNIPF
jgi:hypothetical protein